MNDTCLHILLFTLLFVSCNKQVKQETHCVVSATEVDDEYYKDIPVISVYNLRGSIDGKYKFFMRLSVDSTSVGGIYKYDNQKDYINLSGDLKGNKIELFEAYYDGKEGGREACSKFSGTFDIKKEQISGTWTSGDGRRSYPFEIANYYGVVNPVYTFKSNVSIEVDENGYKSYKITELIAFNKGNNEVQFFSGFDSYPLESTYHIIREDYNFDGYQDMALMEFVPSYPPNKYLFWLYNPDNDTYEQTDILDDVYTLPEIDYKDSTTTTITVWHNQIHYQTYKFDGDKWLFNNSSSEDIGD